jgi:hypothetical protein
MRLNKHQQNLLWSASSKNVENRSLSPLALARKIDAVVAKLHAENPSAFITSVQDGENGEIYFKGIDGLLKAREFYNEPLSVRRDAYKSYVKPLPSRYDNA